MGARGDIPRARNLLDNSSTMPQYAHEACFSSVNVGLLDDESMGQVQGKERILLYLHGRMIQS